MVDRLSSGRWLKQQVPRYSPQTDGKKIRVVDLFCGAGGMTLGVIECLLHYKLNPTIEFATDQDSDAIAVYNSNFHNIAGDIMQDDITRHVSGVLGRKEPTKSEKELLTKMASVEVLLAGPPCQGHSDLNNHTRRLDERNLLYLRAVRFAKLVSPKVILIENVRTVTLDRNGVVQTGRRRLEELGYQVQESVVNAASLGLPQLRKRHLLLATKKRIPELKFDLPTRLPPLSAFIGDLLNEEPVSSDDLFRTASKLSRENLARAEFLLANDLFDLPNEHRPSCHRDKEHSYVSMYGRLSWEKPAQTITSGFGSPGQGRYIHPVFPRVITPHEAARIQGFPDYFTFDRVRTRSKLQTVIGNAVPPVLSAAVLEHAIRNGAL
ncbi:MAG: DNA cytosine methyltransferase [Candidatus Obscuribacterales bacterium]|nr:DNA cytosine methyltransferase [Candidatus Obscuribacterales bacterium]